MYAWPERRRVDSFADFKDSSISIQLDVVGHVASESTEYDVKHFLLNALHYLPVAQSEALREVAERLVDGLGGFWARYVAGLVVSDSNQV